MCGKSNPEELDVCQFCQARLKPLVVDPGAGDDEQAGEDWLGSLRSQGEPLEDRGGFEDESPDWLRDDDLGSVEGLEPDADQDPLARLSGIGPDEPLSSEASLDESDEGVSALSDEAAYEELEGGQEDFSGEAFQVEDSGEGIDLEQWLASLDSNGEQGEEAGSQEEIPDWLANLSDQEPVTDETEEGGSFDVPQPEGAGDDLPDWLARLDSEDKPEAETDLPDWLKAQEESATSSTEQAEEMVPAQGQLDDDEELELPDWLAGLGDEQVEMEEPFEGDQETGQLQAEELEQDLLEQSQPEEAGQVFEEKEESPAWLAELETEGSQPEVGEEQPSEEVQQADEAQSGQEAPEPEEIEPEEPEHGELEPAEAAAEEGEDLPVWLASLTAVDQEWPAEEDQPAQEREIPDWLADLGRAESGAVPEETEAVPTPEEGMPDWLAELSRDVGEYEDVGVEVEAPTSPFALDGEHDAELDSMYSAEEPEWLADVTSIESEEKAKSLDETPAEDDLARAELPGWLQAMRPVSSVATPGPEIIEEESAEVESAGPLMGLSGILPAEPEAAKAGAPEPPSLKLEITENQQKHVALLKSLLELEEQVKPVEKPSRLTSQRILRWVIAICLVVVVGWPIFTGSQTTELPLPIPGALQDANQIIGGLPANSSVMVAFDYEPALSGEMDAAAEAVVQHVMVRGASMSFVSSSPTGPLVAERFMTYLETDRQYVHGQQYLNLGYIPGGPTGLSSFAESPRSILPRTISGEDAWNLQPLMEVRALSDFAAVIAITDSPDTARTWIEQVNPHLGETPLIMVVSAQAEPLVRPYYDSIPRQVDGLVSGLAGGGAYERLTGLNGKVRIYWDAFGYATIAAAVLIVVGAAINIILAMLAQQEQAEGEQSHDPA